MYSSRPLDETTKPQTQGHPIQSKAPRGNPTQTKPITDLNSVFFTSVHPSTPPSPTSLPYLHYQYGRIPLTQPQVWCSGQPTRPHPTRPQEPGSHRIAAVHRAGADPKPTTSTKPPPRAPDLLSPPSDRVAGPLPPTHHRRSPPVASDEVSPPLPAPPPAPPPYRIPLPRP